MMITKILWSTVSNGLMHYYTPEYSNKGPGKQCYPGIGNAKGGGAFMLEGFGMKT